LGGLLLDHGDVEGAKTAFRQVIKSAHAEAAAAAQVTLDEIEDEEGNDPSAG
jgi:hypothetical protein